MTEAHEEAFETLLATWASHQELKNSGAPVADLLESRIKLDNARVQSRVLGNAQLVQLAC